MFRKMAYSAGEHLYCHDILYTHHGLATGEGTVIEYLLNGGVCEVSEEEFADGREILVRREPERVYSGEEAVKRARSRLGEDDYNLFLNNCEGFVTWCLFGENKSRQVRNMARCVPHVGIAIAVDKAVSTACDINHGHKGVGEGFLDCLLSSEINPAVRVLEMADDFGITQAGELRTAINEQRLKLTREYINPVEETLRERAGKFCAEASELADSVADKVSTLASDALSTVNESFDRVMSEACEKVDDVSFSLEELKGQASVLLGDAASMAQDALEWLKGRR